MKQVRFKQAFGLWNATEVAGFEDAIALGYVRAGIASLVEEPAPLVIVPPPPALMPVTKEEVAAALASSVMPKEEPEVPAKE